MKKGGRGRKGEKRGREERRKMGEEERKEER